MTTEFELAVYAAATSRAGRSNKTMRGLATIAAMTEIPVKELQGWFEWPETVSTRAIEQLAEKLDTDEATLRYARDRDIHSRKTAPLKVPLGSPHPLPQRS